MESLVQKLTLGLPEVSFERSGCMRNWALTSVVDDYGDVVDDGDVEGEWWW